jgi:ribulose-5-phosphate 4-epimerase/fuculose-1-phosphate aldolase
MVEMLSIFKDALVESIKESDKETYIDLCRTLGPLTDLVQSTGGNISVKNEEFDTLYIKTSGTRLVNCDFQTYSLKEIRTIVEKNKSLPKGASIETYFHTFPSKFIVHLHPGPALDALTTSIISCDSYKYPIIDYVKPGYDLYLQLVPYKNEKVVILKNHGILLMNNDIDELYETLDEVQRILFTSTMKRSDVVFVSMFREMLQTKFKIDLILKPYLIGLNGFSFHDRIFFPYTPDHSVFLTNAPFMIEPSPFIWSVEALYKDFQKHLITFGEFPTIVCVDGLIYTCAQTFDGCIGLEEMCYSYFCVSNHSLSNPLSESEVTKLKSWSSEIERRRKMGLTNIHTSNTTITHSL